MYIGIDGGGTKTWIVAADDKGNIVAQVKGLGTNVADVGLEECKKRLNDQLTALLGTLDAQVDSVYAGIAGSASKVNHDGVHDILSSLLPNAKIVDNGTDALNPLFGEADGGIVMIAGTGSSAFAVEGSTVTQVGGWGYLIDDAGSGFSIGKAALKTAYRDYDGRGGHTMLTDLISKKLNMPLKQAIPTIYAGGKSFIASFAPIVFDAMHIGDATAKDILLDAASELALHLKLCLTHVSARPAAAVLNGGLTENAEFLDMIRAALGEDAQNIRIIKPDVPPVYGAVVKAVRNAGVEITPEFRTNFMKGLNV